MVLHRLSDLDAAGDDGTRQQALAKGLLAETGTVIVYRQHPEEVPRATRALGPLRTEAQRIGHYPQGVALWRIGGRSYEVRHIRSQRERALTATDAAMAPREPRATDTDREAPDEQRPVRAHRSARVHWPAAAALVAARRLALAARVVIARCSPRC